jgi:tetratricopeptide (TPR) repeat protein
VPEGLRAPRALRDTDLSARTRTLRAFTWSFTGAVVGGMAGYAGLIYGSWGPGTVWLLAIGGGVVTFLGPLAIAALGGRAAGTLYSPSGAGTPRKREHSHAESLAARGLYDEAVAAFEVAIAASPSEPEPYLRVARIHRDRSRRFGEAAVWFKRALEHTEPASPLALLITRELGELYVSKLSGERMRLTPFLARFAAERADTPEGRWAAEELRRVKAGSEEISNLDG